MTACMAASCSRSPAQNNCLLFTSGQCGGSLNEPSSALLRGIVWFNWRGRWRRRDDGLGEPLIITGVRSRFSGRDESRVVIFFLSSGLEEKKCSARHRTKLRIRGIRVCELISQNNTELTHCQNPHQSEVYKVLPKSYEVKVKIP